MSDKKRIMVVDDLDLNHLLFKKILSGQYDLYRAGNGRQALDLLKEHYQDIDIIVSDIYMPQMDGLSMLEQIRKIPEYLEIPIIIVTSVNDRDNEIRALDLGARDLVVRPFDASVLKQRIHNVLRLSEMEKMQREDKKQLQTALEAARNAAAAKQEFLSHMSHEFRTPLNGIKGSLALLSERSELKNDQCLKNAMVSVNHLSSLISDVLDMAKIESGKMDLELSTFPVSLLFEQLEAIMSPLAMEKGIQLKFHIKEIFAGIIKADRKRLRQIMINLLSNAIKYTEPGGCVDFGVHGGHIAGTKGCLYFYVKDNGIGMEQDFIKKAFEPFEQGKISDRTDGTGLGLAITKNLVDLMNGKITVQSKPGIGTEIFVSLKIEYVAKKEHEIAPRLCSNSRQSGEKFMCYGRRALLVEDNPINMQIAQLLLESMGIEVEMACNGSIAVECFQKSRIGWYDLICMDIMMPEMDGYTASKLIRSMHRPDADKVIIIAMTANAFAEDIEKARESGMDYHLSKPIEKKELVYVLSQEFRKKL